MDNLGEVGQKMRCAVKAKLVELGTGGATGYIDDELPDYIMVMIANKRTKQQMISDLNLFLGDQTEIFVTWLHEVLQKLQEVTLPNKAVAKNKRKSEPDDQTANKKEKKEKKKEKKAKKQHTSEKQTSSELIVAKPTISEVVADHLLEKAKQAVSPTDVKSKKEEVETNNSNILNNDFDIPTISEIRGSGISSGGGAANAVPTPVEINKVGSNREKDLAELAEIQKKIYKAKRHLKKINSNEENSDDEDFLNIREDTDAFEDYINKGGTVPGSTGGGGLGNRRSKSPIVFDKTSSESNDSRSKKLEREKRSFSRTTTPPIIEIKKPFRKELSRGNDKQETNPSQRKSVHERLGLQFRRRSSSSPDNRRKDIERSHNYQEKLHLTERKSTMVTNKKIEISTDKKRIVSRVIVASNNKKINSSDDDDDNEDEEDTGKSISSIVTIKPRPKLTASSQAPKNLLLRAVAEAQKSTVAAAATKRNTSDRETNNLKKETALLRLGSRQQRELYSKSYRTRHHPSSNVKTETKKDNIVIQLNADNNFEEEEESDEYIPEPSKRRDNTDYVYYVPTATKRDDNEEYNDSDRGVEPSNNAGFNQNTQFVVTLDEKSGDKYMNRNKKKYSGLKENRKLNVDSAKKSTGEKLISSSKNIIEDNENNGNDETEISLYYKKPKEVQKIIIQNNDSDDDVEPQLKSSRKNNIKTNNNNNSKAKSRSKEKSLDRNSSERSDRRKKSSVSPIRFDLDKDFDNRTISISEEKSKETKVSTKKNDVESKYDKIPELLSAVAINKSSIKTKPKDRCKFFPTCTNSDCEFFHPSAPCKAFPNCKYAEKCLYIHPKCKFDSTCTRSGCNYSHSVIAPSVAPPLSSHVVPVQNYKSISAAPLPALCKYYPNCTNSVCNFYHPKPCRFGKLCNNKIECNFFHHDLPQPRDNKFKWVNGLA